MEFLFINWPGCFRVDIVIASLQDWFITSPQIIEKKMET